MDYMNQETSGVSAQIGIEHYFPKGYDPNAEPWESIRQHHAAAIQDAKQHGNEDTARRLRPGVCAACPVDVGLCPHCGTVWERRGESRIGHKMVMQNFLREDDAARGVQPAAKDPRLSCLDLSAPSLQQKVVAHSAQQESAPAAEQAELLNKAKLLRSVLKKTDYDATTWNMAKVVADELLELIEGASSPAQDKPAAESVELHRLRDDIAAEAAIANRDDPAHPRTEATMKAIGAVLNTWVARLDAALSASSPSEQKSSLPAETRTPQERESRETGGAGRVIGGIVIPAAPPVGVIDALRAFVTAVYDYEETGVWPDNGTIRRLAEQGKDALEGIGRNLSPDAAGPTGSGVAPPKSESAASAATPKENQ